MAVCLRMALLLLLLSLQLFPITASAQGLIKPGDSMPELTLTTPTSATDRKYLQLTDPSFTPSQIQADLLLIELLNVHCPHCQMQAPAYNQLFQLIESNPESRGKIKMLGLAVGNLASEVEKFKQIYQIPFPILADPDFTAWRQIGAGATPLTLLVRQDRIGQPGVISGIQQGLNTQYQNLFTRLMQLTTEDPAALREKVRVHTALQQRVKPILSSAELEYRIRTAFIRFGTIEDFSALTLLSGRKVYTALIRQGQGRQRLFAEISSRSSVCDICHDVHFFYLFDRSTRILAFEPLQLTKYGNLNWNQADVERMRNNVVGKHLSRPQPFNPKVDAVSSATITSAIIFDSLAQGEELFEELRAMGLF